MNIVIQNDGIISPFNIKYSAETKFSLMPATRDMTDENEAADGEIDFGTEFDMGDFTMHGIIEFDTLIERNSVEDELRRLLNECRKSQQIIYEHTPDKFIMIKLSEKPDIKRYPRFLEVRAQFKTDPFWFSTEEHSLTGNGTITNNGTFETPLTIEIAGLVTNPSVIIGSDTLAYTGTIPSGQTLILTVIANGSGTAKIGSVNAMVGYNKAFPTMQPGSINITASSNVTIKWRDCYL
jgi:phage-related protein